MKKVFLILFILLAGTRFVFADSKIDGKTVSFTEFVDEMVKADKNTTFENVKIRYVLAIDKQGMDKRFDNGGPEIIIKQRVRWLNCDFDPDYWLVLRNVTFEDYLAVFECKPVKAIFKSCTFKKTFRLYTSEVEFIDFDTCNFGHGFKCGRSNIKDHLKFSGCNFTVDPGVRNETNEYDMEARIFLMQEKSDAVDLTLQGCKFNLPLELRNDPQYFVNLSSSSFTNLRLINCFFDANVDFSQSTVSNTFLTYDCVYNYKVLMDAFNVNPNNTRAQWSTLDSMRIAVFEPKSKRILSGTIVDSIKDEFQFDNLISCYATLYSAFKAQGNKLAANACYVEWKNLETQYLKNNTRREGGRKDFFYYLMNQFLYIFCDYGTNPLKAINIALYVLLAFACIYFFFPYTVKAFGRRTLFEQLKLYGYYLASPRSLLEIEDSDFAKDKEPKSYSEYISFLQTTGKKIPWYFHIFGTPIYLIEKMKSKPSKIFYKFIDWFPDEWQSMSGSKKLLATVAYGFVVFTTIFWYLLIHTLDSVMLSLNVFSTLGFGQIPIKGIPRYLTIIEGFVGWFLLSIFSVSLISQVIQ